MNYQATKGAKKRTRLCAIALGYSFMSLAGLTQEYRASIEHSCSAGELARRVAMLPLFCVKFHPVNNGSPS